MSNTTPGLRQGVTQWGSSFLSSKFEKERGAAGMWRRRRKQQPQIEDSTVEILHADISGMHVF